MFDLIVLGGGSGGMATAVRAAKYGAKVAVVEENHLGGTCVNLGCIPKKMMFNAATIATMLEKAPDYGFDAFSTVLSWQTLVHKRNHYIEYLRQRYAERFDDFKMTYLHGKGVFINANTIAINGNPHQAKHIVIATGGKPNMPNNLSGMEYALDSDGFFELMDQPKKVVIVGTGYIGVELAGFLQALGSDVHLIMRKEKPLSRFDAMLGNKLLLLMHEQGIHTYANQDLASIQLQPNGQKMLTTNRETVLHDLDAVIVAVGRVPRTFGLNLEQIGVKTNNEGLVVVDKYQNTSVSGIYAIGDVSNSPALTPVAIAAGRKLADRLFGEQKDAHLDYANICSVIFSHPPIGSVGLSEQDALAQYGKDSVHVYSVQFNPLFDAFSTQKTPTSIKLITHGKKEKIIGLHIIGNAADEILQGFGVAIKMGACKKDFNNTLAIHPTSAEEVVLL